MSPRRRLRTRYEQAVPTAPAEPAVATPERSGAEAVSPAAPARGEATVAVPVEFVAEPAVGTSIPVDLGGTPAATIEPARPSRHRLRGTLTLVGFALLAFGTGMWVFDDLVMPRLIHGVGQVTVPDLANLTVPQAERALQSLGLQISLAGERFDPAVPRGFVLSQDPEAGISVRGHLRVSVMVSLGEEFSSVPELSGESVRGARLLIERAGLRVGATVRAASDEVGEGQVVASDPGPEAVLQRDTPVHLLVSIGPGPESFVMPELLGREITGVTRQLEALGFRVEMPPAAPSVGTIVSQVPAPGARIARDTVIQLLAAGRRIR